MCGRFTLSIDTRTLAEHFDLSDVPTLFSGPRYNIAPTQEIPVVRLSPDEGEREATMMHWGLIPSWADDPDEFAGRMINARGETVDKKPMFKRAFSRRRCLIPADGFYEWRSRGKGKPKQPHFIRVSGQDLFAFGGLWEYWKDKETDNEIVSCTILTTDPNELVRPLHDRMPVVIGSDNYGVWLDSASSADEVKPLLRPYPAERMEAWPVTRAVNSPRNDSAACIEPLSRGETDSLFGE